MNLRVQKMMRESFSSRTESEPGSVVLMIVTRYQPYQPVRRPKELQLPTDHQHPPISGFQFSGDPDDL